MKFNRMYLLSKILIFCALFHLSTASLYVFLSRGMSLEWIRQISSVSHTDHFKTFSDIFYDSNSHKLALLKDYDIKDKFKVISNLTIRTHKFDGQIETKSCSVIPPRELDENCEVSAEKLLFLKSDRVFISWKIVHGTKGEHTLFKVISLDTCYASDFVKLNVAANITHNIGRKFYKIIRSEETFDVIFENFKICPRAYCKFTFDYDGGKVGDDPLAFLDQFLGKNETLFINTIDAMKTDSGVGIVLTGKKNQSPTNGRVFIQDIYSPNSGWAKATALSSDYIFVSEYQSYSNENGFATLCWLQIFRNKLACEFLDGRHRVGNRSDNTLTLEIDRRVRMPRISNTRDGQIIMMSYGSEGGYKFIFIDKVGVDGRCKRLIKNFSKSSSYPQYYLLTITKQNQFCFSFIMWRNLTNRKYNYVDSYTYAYEFITQCIEFPLYFTPDDIVCGTGYL